MFSKMFFPKLSRKSYEHFNHKKILVINIKPQETFRFHLPVIHNYSKHTIYTFFLKAFSLKLTETTLISTTETLKHLGDMV